jgi:hypothetical protein
MRGLERAEQQRLRERCVTVRERVKRPHDGRAV